MLLSTSGGQSSMVPGLTTLKVGTKLFILLGLCIQKGWVTDIDAVFRSNSRDPLPPAARASLPSPALDTSAGAISSSSSSAGPVAKAVAKKTGVVANNTGAEKAKGRQVISSLMQKSQNSLHALCRLMADTTRRETVRSIIGLGEHLAEEHNMNCKVKTEDEGH
jgi:hypothetical protein